MGHRVLGFLSRHEWLVSCFFGWFGFGVPSRSVGVSIWDFPKIRVPLFGVLYNQDPTI